MPLALVVHGGAGLIRRDSLTPEREDRCRAGLRAALDAGWAVLHAGGSALDAVQASVVALEEDPAFNAGRGAVLAAGGTVELDAAIMDGTGRAAGAIAGATLPRSPIAAARAVLSGTPHVLLCGPGADAFIVDAGLETADASWFETPERRAQYEAVAAVGGYGLDHGPLGGKKDVYGTVGAVACDRGGHVAAATSTGGMVNKLHGRVGDTPVIGAGTYAWDQTCAVSGTGHGEPFIRLAVAHRISDLMELAGLSVAEAAERVIRVELPAVAGEGGVIAVDAAGRIAMPFNTGGMFRGWRTEAETGVQIW
jgi:L-asparaginase/beta-aspartyl-peptidase (threonine type)